MGRLPARNSGSLRCAPDDEREDILKESKSGAAKAAVSFYFIAPPPTPVCILTAGAGSGFRGSISGRFAA